MSWSYSGNPASSTRDEVRFLIGDTDSTDQQMTDEEIDYLRTVHADLGAGVSNYLAAASAALALASKYAKMSDKTVGSLSISYSQKHSQFLSLAKSLENKATANGQTASRVGPPVLGGGGQTYLGGTWT